MMNISQTLKGRRILIVGFEREGVALARVLSAEGAHVTVSDRRSAADLAASIDALTREGIAVRFSLGENRIADVLDSDIIFVSPGVPPTIPALNLAREHNIPISSQTALFFARCTAPIIGITGSSGKTTTTTVIGEMLRAEHTDGRMSGVFVGGNIGVPLIEDVATIPASAWVVLELSSFQLETLTRSPHIAVVTNITPNHLDRHGTMENYVAAKSQIVRHQKPGDVLILNAADPYTPLLSQLAADGVSILLWSMDGAVLPLDRSSLRPSARLAAYLDDDRLVLACGPGGQPGDPITLCHRDDLRVPGRHNIANFLAAAVATAAAGGSPDAIRAVARSFTGVAHRLERVRTLEGVDYYNDSIATAPERVLAALAVFDRPLVLLVGGRDKHLPWAELTDAMTRQCRGLVLFGEAAAMIEEQVSLALHRAATSGQATLLREGGIARCPDLLSAVRTARDLAQVGDVVLLSPGCTSYDMYKDFAERGDHFRQIVNAL